MVDKIIVMNNKLIVHFLITNLFVMALEIFYSDYLRRREYAFSFLKNREKREKILAITFSFVFQFIM